MRRHTAAPFLLGLALVAGSAAAQQQKPPYWASIEAGQAKARTGPGRNFPATWLYQRKGLPVKVIETYPAWRKIEDPDGAQGWMQANLLSDNRTAMVTGEIRPMRASPDPNAPVIWRAEPGVIGKIRKCSNGWCWFDVGGRRGWIQTDHIWGVNSGETVK